MKKHWETLLATSAAVSIALGGVVVTSATAQAADQPSGAQVVDGSTGAQVVDPAAPAVGDAPTADVPAAEPVADEGTAPVEAPADEDAPEAAPSGAASPVAEEPADAAPVDAAETDAEVEAAALAPAPDAPVITEPFGEIGIAEVTAAQGATETDVPLTFSGTGQPGAVVALDFRRDDGVQGIPEPDTTAVVSAEGTWSSSFRIVPGRWGFSATQRTVDADGVATSEASAASRERLIVVIAQVLPQWATLDQTADETWVADQATSNGDEFVSVPVSGTTGTLYRAEISVNSADGSIVYGTFPTEEYRDGGWSARVDLAPGQYRIGARQIDVDTYPGVRRATSAENFSPVITVLASGEVVTTAPVVTSPADGEVVVGAAGPDGVLVDFQGTGQPGHVVSLYAEDRRTGQIRSFSYGSETGDPLIVVGADGRWSTGEVAVPLGFQDVVVSQFDPTLQNPLISDVTELSIEVRVASATAGAPGATVPASGSLAYTGSDESGPALLGGALAIALGALALVVSRMRRGHLVGRLVRGR
jgi:hypothetical protein